MELAKKKKKQFKVFQNRITACRIFHNEDYLMTSQNQRSVYYIYKEKSQNKYFCTSQRS